MQISSMKACLLHQESAKPNLVLPWSNLGLFVKYQLMGEPTMLMLLMILSISTMFLQLKVSLLTQ